MPLISKKDKDALFLKAKHELGWPKRPIDKMIDNSMMVSYLEMAIEDYSACVNDWLIRQNFVNLEGKNASETDFLADFTYKSNDYIRSFEYAYSKQVGLGTNAPAAKGWELKRDYMVLSAHTQTYIIPKNRSINQILWHTPSEVGLGTLDPFMMGGFAGGVFPGGFGMMTRPGIFQNFNYSSLLSAQDFRMKQRMLQSTLTYKITGLATGEKILTLYPVPGSMAEISSIWGKHYAGTKVFYFYYETNPKNEKKCKAENPDVILLPSDVKVDVLIWNRMNSVAQQMVRDLFIARVKMGVGNIGGWATGELGAGEAKKTLDYRHWLDDGKELKQATLDKLEKTLDALTQVNLTDQRARIAENVNKAAQYQPFRTPIIPI